MTDLSITEANVRFGVNARFIQNIKAGVALTRLQPVYISTDGKVYLGDANASVTTAKVVGLAAQDVGADQLVDVLFWDDDLTVGATLTPVPYVLSASPGGIAPAADLTTGWNLTLLLVPKSATKAIVAITPTGFAA